ncbi:hypothetical protein L2Y96_14225 [Luteibacter aegosomaticola]|uniref:hypothetical protein n=1 Tax=Luteibacter aegosomaticola TaxID=2911538 RepID=UPI001FFC1A07|nr:hypothetical protein [Luteibacter aegosomaticola]UPG88575.1 hypothetical protein L2Y96_14225 [Luteibacter aegosomaticola]
MTPRVLCTLCYVLAFVSVRTVAAVANPTPHVASEAQAETLALDAIARHHLTSLAPACLALMSEDLTNGWSIDVHELHDEKCGGDPETSPRLFTIDVDATTGAMTTDALDPADGEMQSLD